MKEVIEETNSLCWPLEIFFLFVCRWLMITIVVVGKRRETTPPPPHATRMVAEFISLQAMMARAHTRDAIADNGKPTNTSPRGWWWGMVPDKVPPWYYLLERLPATPLSDDPMLWRGWYQV